MTRYSLLRAGRIAALFVAACPMIANQGRVNDLVDRTLEIHNVERARLGIRPLRWDHGLARDAAAWAAHLATIGTLVHSEDDPSDPDPEGENLWAGTAGAYTVDAMSEYWAAERRDYKPGIFPASSRSGNLETVGHYTQMVWRSTTRVGCALARGKSDEFFVCRYGEGGNVIGERPF